MSDLKKFLQDNFMHYQIEQLKDNIENKKIIIYGCGLLFQTIREEYDLSEFNIIGICDKKFAPEDEGKDLMGYDIIPYIKLPEYSADYIIVAVQNYYPVISELKRIIKNSKIIPLVNLDFKYNDIRSIRKDKNSLINKIFSIKKNYTSTTVTICGLKFRFEDKYKKLLEEYKFMESRLNFNQKC